MTKVMLGGLERELQPLTFYTVKQIWPIIQSVNTVYSDVMTKTGCTMEEAMQYVDPLWQVEQGIRIISYAIAQDDPEYVDPNVLNSPNWDRDYAFNKLSREIKATEVNALQPVVTALMMESGFDMTGPKTEGKEESGEPSTGTGTDSSLSSLQRDVREEAGT